MVSSVQMPVYAAESTGIEQEDGEAVEIAGEENAEEESRDEAEPVEASAGQDSEPTEILTGQDSEPEPEDAAVYDPVEAVNADREDEGTADSDIEINEAEDSGVLDAGDEEIPALAEVQAAESGDDADIPATMATTTTYTIVKQPTLNTYFTGENVDPSGAQLEILETTDENEKRTIVPIDETMLAEYDSSEEGVKEIDVSYNGKSVGSFKVLYVKSLSKALSGEKLSIEYGKELSEIADKLPSSSLGNWEWQDETQTANKIGKQKFKVEFSPKMSYKKRDADAEVTVTCSLDTSEYVEITLPSEELKYDGTEKKLKNVTVKVGGTTLVENRDYKLKYENNTNAGEASVTVEGITSAYYTGSVTEKFSIAKAQLTFTAETKTIFYRSDNDIDASKLTYEYTVTGLASKDHLTKEPKLSCRITDIDNPNAVGNYEIYFETDEDGKVSIEIDSSVSGNYDLENIKYISGTLYVQQFMRRGVRIVGVNAANAIYNKAQWTNAANARVVYTDTNNDVPNIRAVPSYEGTCKQPDKDGNYAYSSTSAPTGAGDYTLTFTLGGKDADDYALEESSAYYEFTIAQQVITIKADSYLVKAGEKIPDISTRQDKYTVEGLLKGDKLEDVLEMEEGEDGKKRLKLTVRYSDDDASANKAGTFAIIPEGAVLKNQNYRIVYANGELEVEGRKKYIYDVTSIAAEDMTYNGRKHSIKGYAKGMEAETFRIEVTGETRKQEEDSDKKLQYVRYEKKMEEVSPADILTEYQKIAPTDVGNYTLWIYSNIDQAVFEYDDEPILKKNFKILPLQKYETKIVGVTGMADKEKVYDGKEIDLSEQIKDAKVRTNHDVDITDKVSLEVWIKEKKSADGESNGYQDTKFSRTSPDVTAMPSEAGEYNLQFKMIADESGNYLSNEWNFPFVIKKRGLTVTVKDKRIPVNAKGTLPDPSEYEYVITDDTIKDEEKKVLNNEDFDRPLIEPFGEVDTTMSGSYDLLASGNIVGDKESNYAVSFVPGKLYVQIRLWGVKELNITRNKNIPHGTTLEKIAEEYLPKKVTIYLDEDRSMTEEADILWDTQKLASGVYNVNNTAAQNFKMQGKIVLPNLVYIDDAAKLDLPDSISLDGTQLTVLVDVSVREANDGSQALKPYADLASGSYVGPGTKVSLFTDEEGAYIYYTIEADNPALSVSGRRYTGPIEVKCTMVIRAVSRVSGKQDSEELRLVYYYRNQNTGDNDPNNPGNRPSTVPDEDIPKDENGKPLEIPNDIWVTDVADYTYTGEAIKPEVRVYDYGTRLEEGKDYTVSYRNNVNAAEKPFPASMAPTVVIKLKGNYEGKIEKYFTIARKDIRDMHEENGRPVYDVKVDDITVVYNDKAQSPVVAAAWNGRKLVNKKDYTFEFVPKKEAGSYPVTVEGCGNYTGERQFTFRIFKGKLAKDFKVNKIGDYIYAEDKVPFKPAVVVTYKGNVLREGIDYSVSYEDNTAIGTASVVITGINSFAGVKRVYFKIREAATLNKAKAELVFASGAVYTGKEIVPSEIKMAVKVNNKGAVETRGLTEGKDYKVTYRNNINVGKATAIFEGIGAYRGTLKKTFMITPYSIENMQPEQISVGATCQYMKGGARQKATIRFDGNLLVEGKDYTLSYKNNKTVGSTAVVTIRGKGNFKGSTTRTYQVTVREFSNNMVVAADKVYQAKANNFKTKIRVLDNGKALKAGKDYDKNVIYTYAEKTILTSGVEKNKDDPIMEQDIIQPGVKINVTVSAIGDNYHGEATGEFRMIQADLSKAKVTVPTRTYTGKEITFTPAEITVTLQGIPLTSDDYRIVGYSNNRNKGTAKLTIQGQGLYGGTKTVTFKIKGRKKL